MAFDTTILTEKIEKLKEKYTNGSFADALIGAVNAGNGLMQQRIFTLNEDVLGESFGAYIGRKSKTKLNITGSKRSRAIAGLDLTPYQKKRAAAGRQIIKKDLEFTGNLRRSIVTAVESEKAAVIEFNNDEAAIIARGQEVQITNIRLGGKGTTRGVGVKIFRLNPVEREEVVAQGLELISQEMAR